MTILKEQVATMERDELVKTLFEYVEANEAQRLKLEQAREPHPFEKMVEDVVVKLLEGNSGLTSTIEDIVEDKINYEIDYNSNLDYKIEDKITDAGYLTEYEIKDKIQEEVGDLDTVAIKELVNNAVDERVEYEFNNLQVEVKRG